MTFINSTLLLVICSLAGLVSAYFQGFEEHNHNINLRRRESIQPFHLQRRQLSDDLQQLRVRNLYPRAKNWKSFTIPSPASSRKGSSKASSLVDTQSSFGLSRSSTGSSGSRSSLGSNPNSPKSPSSEHSAFSVPKSGESGSSGHSSSSSVMRRPLLNQETRIQEYPAPGSPIAAKHGRQPQGGSHLQGIQEVPDGIAERTGIQEYHGPPKNSKSGLDPASAKNNKIALTAQSQNGKSGLTPASVAAMGERTKTRGGFRSWFGGSRSSSQKSMGSNSDAASVSPSDVGSLSGASAASVGSAGSAGSGASAASGNNPAATKSGGFFSRLKGMGRKQSASSGPFQKPPTAKIPVGQFPIGGGEYVV